MTKPNDRQKSRMKRKTTHLQWQKAQQSHLKSLQIAYFSVSPENTKDFENFKI
jgi:hypothetical protein